MPMWIVKICDPEGIRDKDECFGIFDTLEHAAEWAGKHVPTHITWHTHHVRTHDTYRRDVWEARVPDYIDSLRS